MKTRIREMLMAVAAEGTGTTTGKGTTGKGSGKTTGKGKANLTLVEQAENELKDLGNTQPEGTPPEGTGEAGIPLDETGNDGAGKPPESTPDPNSTPTPNLNAPPERVKKEKMEDFDLKKLFKPIDSVEKTVTVQELFENKESYRFDLAVQRNKVWSRDQQSMLIHSLIEGYPVPETHAREDVADGMNWMVDGQQRVSTLIDFVGDNFEITNNTPLAFNEVDISGYVFSELAKCLQDKILQSKIKVVKLRNINDDQLAEMFYRLNNGSPLKPIELTRALLGSTMNIIREVSDMTFFSDMLSMTDTARNRFVDQELIMQTVSVLSQADISLSTKDIREFMLTSEEEKITTNIELLKVLTPYMEQAFVNMDEKARKKCLKKTNVPMLFAMAKEVVHYNSDKKTNLKITAEKFAEWAKSFLFDNFGGKTKSTEQSQYGNASNSGSAKKDNKDTRLKILTGSLHKTFPALVVKK